MLALVRGKAQKPLQYLRTCSDSEIDYSLGVSGNQVYQRTKRVFGIAAVAAVETCAHTQQSVLYALHGVSSPRDRQCPTQPPGYRGCGSFTDWDAPVAATASQLLHGAMHHTSPPK
jgi:hypothetical protein